MIWCCVRGKRVKYVALSWVRFKKGWDLVFLEELESLYVLDIVVTVYMMFGVAGSSWSAFIGRGQKGL